MTGDPNSESDYGASSSSSSSSVDSAEEALCQVLGLSSFQAMTLVVDEQDQEHVGDAVTYAMDFTSSANLSSSSLSLWDTILQQRSDEYIAEIVQRYELQRVYRETSVCTLPPELSIPAQLLRRWTEEVVWATPEQHPQILRTYETVTVQVVVSHSEPTTKEQQQQQQQQHYECRDRRHRRVLTRLENLNSHPGWHALCNDYVRRCVRAIIIGPPKQQQNADENEDVHLDENEDVHLFKTKLNLKPPGTSGFAPHVDTPSLRIALGDAGPQEFVTVMLAIDDMTEQNGCLRLAVPPQPPANSSHQPQTHSQPWNAANVPVVQPRIDGNPDAEGRAGAIPLEVAEEQLTFTNLTCTGGTLALFGGWVPHRSAANRSPCAPRRALFVTYSLSGGGDFHDLYYERMAQRRWAWKEQRRQQPQQQQQQATATSLEGLDQEELVALSTIPRI